MKIATMHNEQSSAPTSRSERQLDVELSEADYLTREVTDAKAALSKSLDQLRIGLANSADLRQWVKHYPLASIGAAAATGFAAAAAVTPAQGESITDKLSRLVSERGPDTIDDSSRAAARQNPPKRATVMDNLITSLFDLAKVLVQTLIVATFQQPKIEESPGPLRPESRATSLAK
jgi:hypothetical protein